ncbi:MAG: hypothetical protein AB8B58_09915 [Roseobacter sp.]
MRNKLRYLFAVLTAVFTAVQAPAQDAPLSVIDWLHNNPDPPEIDQQTGSGPERSRLPPDVTVQSLDADQDRLIGLVPSRVTELPETLWRGSAPQTLQNLLKTLPDVQVPAAQSLLYALLLNESTGPGNDVAEADLFTVARVRTLMHLGALDPAMALAEQADITRDAAHFAVYMEIALLTGQEDAACAVQSVRSHLAPDLAHRIFCAVRAGDWGLAALLFDSGRAVGAFDAATEAALERFLDPEFAEEAPQLPVPIAADVTPLLFRLHESIGEPIPTGFLPRAYAVADLRDIVGWKAQLEAAERLARAGVLPANQLLGLYTERAPAASGGIWDRVAAVTRLDTALRTKSADAVTKTLPTAWDQMRDAGLASAFATLFSEDLSKIALAGYAKDIAVQLALIAPQTTPFSPDAGDAAALLRNLPAHPMSDAVAQGLTTQPPRADLMVLAREDRVGEALLGALRLLEDGASGDPHALSSALATLTALGHPRVAGQAAAEILVLGPFS